MSSAGAGVAARRVSLWKVLQPVASDKVLRWLLFGVAFAVLPIVANYLLAITQNSNPAWSVLLGRGELLLVSAGIAATGAGELQGSAPACLRRFQIFISAMAYLVVCLASLWFAAVATSIATRVAVNEQVIVQGSLIVFGAAVIVGGSCVALAGMK